MGGESSHIITHTAEKSSNSDKNKFDAKIKNILYFTIEERSYPVG